MDADTPTTTISESDFEFDPDFCEEDNREQFPLFDGTDAADIMRQEPTVYMCQYGDFTQHTLGIIMVSVAGETGTHARLLTKWSTIIVDQARLKPVNGGDEHWRRIVYPHVRNRGIKTQAQSILALRNVLPGDPKYADTVAAIITGQATYAAVSSFVKILVELHNALAAARDPNRGTITEQQNRVYAAMTEKYPCIAPRQPIPGLGSRMPLVPPVPRVKNQRGRSLGQLSGANIKMEEGSPDGNPVVELDPKRVKLNTAINSVTMYEPGSVVPTALLHRDNERLQKRAREEAEEAEAERLRKYPFPDPVRMPWGRPPITTRHAVRQRSSSPTRSREEVRAATFQMVLDHQSNKNKRPREASPGR
jgi:hypothetical protein